MQELDSDDARRQESHVSVAAICVTIVADLVGGGSLEDVIRVVRVAELALIQPYLIHSQTSSRKTRADSKTEKEMRERTKSGVLVHARKNADRYG